jgi:nuclear pore complex protein Nup98-Nup96
MKRVPQLHNSVDADSMPDAAEASEIDEIARTIPRLIGILPDVLRDRTDPRHNVAVAEMISKLMLCMQAIKPLAIVRTFHILTFLLDY